jgi:hypothetical protein
MNSPIYNNQHEEGSKQSSACWRLHAGFLLGLLNFQQSTWHYILKDKTFHNHLWKNLKSYRSNINLYKGNTALKWTQIKFTFHKWIMQKNRYDIPIEHSFHTLRAKNMLTVDMNDISAFLSRTEVYIFRITNVCYSRDNILFKTRIELS